ncbi:uncharacterized protein MYCFIDRAFT_186716 [Pseudocercospora fijiensis CIRAD86]|uniref:Mitochondrial intermembrane space import and assembly protein 40 n=1 Tax=Pseudocercospora fijiensis (strain CIRAD86) TaxID=383855 RepID=M3BBF7_PSEFD|nr:uncharacterized protein MYCFIDRAFT_186716 [Pseudocercospora fijiensis CIRAD86]EME86553.1 hypothetical protein MYCFIDRAFT_186716 [Pseudocercospora fijiensis CIRAD86]
MFRPAFRAASAARSIPKAQKIGRRFASTSSAKSGSWKGTALRWTAAGAIVYYYNTASVFAEEPASEQRRAQARANLHASQLQEKTESPQTVAVSDGEPAAQEGAGALEEEADQQGAFNEETGEINWDCPCLGGMAHGPCGEQFRAAFSCFVYSKEEPKGVDCIEHFKTMQNCFRDHPDIYGAELDDEEVAEVQAEEDRAQVALAQRKESTESSPESAIKGHDVPAQTVKQTSEPVSDTEELVPKAWHDGRSSTDK